MLQTLEKRYNILRMIYYNQPIGRRVLANHMGIGERIVRTEINFLSQQNLIEINSPGMSMTSEGEEIIDKLKDFIHELKGLSELEKVIAEKLKIKKVIILPGDSDVDDTVMDEIGRATGNYLKGIIKNNEIIALTGGTTMKSFVDNFPKSNNCSNLLVLPARGGMGKNIEIQANTLVSNLAKKLNANYKLLHVPDNLSSNALSTMLMEDGIKSIIDKLNKSDILIYGIGKADDMAKRRGLSEEKIDEIEKSGAVGEAFGYYFNTQGHIVYTSPTIGLQNDQVNSIEKLIAIAGGKKKAKAIISVELNRKNSTLITDEGTANEILKVINNNLVSQ